MKSRGMRRLLIGKLSTARCVCAPHSASLGTFNSPRLSRSMRQSLVRATLTFMAGKSAGDLRGMILR